MRARATGEKSPVPVCYVDGHRKPVYAAALIPRGLIGRTGKILGCRALGVLHDQEGHPLVVTTHRGDQHLTLGLPAILTQYEQAASAAGSQESWTASGTRDPLPLLVITHECLHTSPHQEAFLARMWREYPA
jgi:hypothetical protein